MCGKLCNRMCGRCRNCMHACVVDSAVCACLHGKLCNYMPTCVAGYVKSNMFNIWIKK